MPDKTLESVAAVELSRLRDIGWAQWDPIGLSDIRDAKTGDVEDEYDCYLLQVVSRLRRGDSHEGVVDYLVRSETKTIGIKHHKRRRARAEETVRQIAEYLETLAPGPLRVR